jgi:hypothetical protein
MDMPMNSPQTYPDNCFIDKLMSWVQIQFFAFAQLRFKMENAPFKQPSAAKQAAAATGPSGLVAPAIPGAVKLSNPLKRDIGAAQDVSPAAGKASASHKSPSKPEAKPAAKKAKTGQDKAVPRRSSHAGVKDPEETLQNLRDHIRDLGGELPAGWRCEVCSLCRSLFSPLQPAIDSFSIACVPVHMACGSGVLCCM